MDQEEDREEQIIESLDPFALGLAQSYIEAKKRKAAQDAEAQKFRDPYDMYWIDDPPERVFRKNGVLVDEWKRKKEAMERQVMIILKP